MLDCTETLASRQNNPLAAAEALIARPWLLAAETEFSRIDDEIQRLEMCRNTLLPPVEVYRVALAPHKMLPIDVLREIFVHCAPNEATDLTALKKIGGRRTGFLLKMHELWSNVAIRGFRQPLGPLVERLGMWLSRSGQYPLSLEFLSHPLEGLHLCQLLIRYSRQRRTIYVNSMDLRSPFFDLLPGSLTLLKILILTITPFDPHRKVAHSSPRLRPTSVFVGAPCLRIVTLHLAVRVDLAMLSIPWHQLTELYVGVDADGCTTLTTARFDATSTEPIPVTDRTISLPSLRTLEIIANDLGTAGRISYNFALPSLLTLAVNVARGAGATTISVVPGFPTLQRIIILEANGLVCVSEIDLVHWLRAYPSVTEAFLAYCKPPASTLSQIAGGSLLPNVETLTFYEAASVPLIAMLEARQCSATHSTMSAMGVEAWTEDDWRQWALKDHPTSFRELLKGGVFVCRSPSDAPDRGEIEKSARLDYERGWGVYDRG
ncbi:hypothetical protein DFH09DRAFT_1336587 [Mycena vulgaris]|nr:hypothetical protein DFH09DRAFT_1336587 [Mycena vulgaris]